MSQHRSETQVFDPAVSVQWLSLADRLQLERELADLPALADILERNYDALLARGDRDPDDRSVRYVTRFDVLDLADRRGQAWSAPQRIDPPSHLVRATIAWGRHGS